ncbi:MAG: hypothetical protein WD824_11020 [Cyclobacteriaceae bacterium]
MNFITITQYFNKLQIVLFSLLIVPLLVFIALYFFVDGITPDPRKEYLVIISSAVLFDWLMATIIFNKKIKSVRKAQGLGPKLDKYFGVTIVRFSLLSSASLILAVGFYLTKSDVFTALYVGGLVLAGLLWPTSSKVADDLQLKGDESP